jgi:hypothetical protein
MGLGSEIPDPGVKKAPDPGSRSATQVFNEKGQKFSEATMPHRRRKKKEADTKLVFNADTSVLYLSVRSVSEDTAQVPLDTFLVLSVISYAGGGGLRAFNVRSVIEEGGGEMAGMAVGVGRESVGLLVPAVEVPKPVSCCRYMG